ncbi:hypothetical protein N8508_00185 [bacterium]|nr:hypothetical protein [bacterium]
MEFLGNAFSLQMLEQPMANIEVREIEKSRVPFDTATSVIGHADLANILGVKTNRVNTKLESGDILYVAQYVGGRLPDGTTTLPDGAEIKFYKVTISYGVER